MPATVAIERSAQGFPVKQPVERLLAETSNCALGAFACMPDAPFFRDSGPSSTYCLVFPRTHVRLRHAGSSPFLSGPSTVNMYNEGQEYERSAVSPSGDRCDWIAIRPAVLEEIRSAVTSGAGRESRRLFPASHVRAGSSLYLEQRCLFERLARLGQDPVDPLEVDEAVLSLVERVLRDACGVERPDDAATPRQRTLVADARRLLACHAARRVQLADVAKQLHCSVFHLCRTFRRLEGSTVHAYLVRLRLRLALEHLAGAKGDLTRVALDAGFCSHSHFSAAFRREFGMTPSRFVQRSAPRGMAAPRGSH